MDKSGSPLFGVGGFGGTSSLLTPGNNGAGALFSKNGPIFGHGRSPSASTPLSNSSLSSRPSTSASSNRTGVSAQSSNTSASGGETLRRKPSYTLLTKSPKSVTRIRTSSFGAAFAGGGHHSSPEKRRPTVTFRTAAERDAFFQSSDTTPDVGEKETHIAPSERDSISSTAPYANMMLALGGFEGAKPKNVATPMAAVDPKALPLAIALANMPPSPSLESITFQHIQETATKRISTLDYLRKAHEGRVYWFNTLLFSKSDFPRLPSYTPQRLARRATNYLLLGISLPTILDLNSSSAPEFLKCLNALLAEFEAYQQVHPPDGSTGSLSRARIPQMFKRNNTAGKGRRTSSAADIGLPMHASSSDDLKSIPGSHANSSSPSSTLAYDTSNSELLPGEEYHLLLTPSLPFEPDFYETFATLCDVLIDCYTRLIGLIQGPKDCGGGIGELFTKADARVRKIVVQGVVREFEEGCRNGVRGEVAGVGKVVLGGLM